MLQFGMYIMFPIGIMYYFGTNLDSRFSVPDFWPKEGQTHRIPFDRQEIDEELARMKQRRKAVKARQRELERLEKIRTGEISEDDLLIEAATKREGTGRWPWYR